jgi:hypothetical protein
MVLTLLVRGEIILLIFAIASVTTHINVIGVRPRDDFD